MTETITLNSKIDGAPFAAVHARAQGRRRGGVIVLQEIFGIDQYVRADVERWAELGFEVLAPSLFDRQQPGFSAQHSPEGLQEGVRYASANGLDNPIHDIETCFDQLSPAGPVFVVGYCYGGSLAWLAACRIKGLAAASGYYGSLVKANAALDPLCPVVLHFGRLDGHIPADEVADAVAAFHAEVPVHIYEEAGHGFNNEGAEAYHAPSAELARRRTLALFEANGAA